MSDAREGASLRRVQGRLRELIAAEDGVRAGLAAAGDPDGAALARLVTGDARVSPSRRLEVYANAYFYRILDRLKRDFCALERTLGGALFHDLATAYLLACPPRHPSLRNAGDRLADFLETTRAAPFRRRCACAADLARLEWALVEAFDAADAPVVARRELAAVDPVHWGALRFGLQPALALLSFEWPVRELRMSLDRDEPAPPPPNAPAPNRVCVWRADERVHHRSVDALESAVLTAARTGATFAALCERIAAEKGDDEAPAHAAALVSRWQNDCLLAQVELAQP